MISKIQFHFHIALIFCILAYVTYPPAASYRNYFLTCLTTGICIYHVLQFARSLITFLDQPAKLSG